MHFDHDDHSRFIAALTISRRINAAPHHLARILRHLSLFTPSAADRRRPPPITIDPDPVPDGRGAITLHCPHSGITERRLLRTQHLSAWRFTAEIEEDETVLDVRRAQTFALTIDLNPFLQPGLVVGTRVIVSFRFVREPWWPHDIAGTLGGLADHCLRQLEEQATV
ncbi:hypothetical protein MKK50_18335 [Methylobacterium sp. J-043]|nr:hypothetical protein [Methylobacterium sp. J-043]